MDDIAFCALFIIKIEISCFIFENNSDGKTKRTVYKGEKTM